MNGNVMAPLVDDLTYCPVCGN